MERNRVKTSFDSAQVAGVEWDNGLACTPNAAAGVTRTGTAKMRAPRLLELTLTAVEVDITAANDYGSTKLFDLPNSNVMIMGCVFDGVVTGDAVITDVTQVDLAIGTAATASTDFSGTDEKDVCPKIDVAAEGVAVMKTTDTEKNNIKAKGTNAVYLNAACTIGSDATITVAGTVKVLVLDLDPES